MTDATSSARAAWNRSISATGLEHLVSLMMALIFSPAAVPPGSLVTVTA